MKRIMLAAFAGCYLLVPVASRTLRATSNKNDKRPNIVWILADDLHYELAELERMPHLHNMKKESLEFVNHVSQSPLCGPSRASMLVGRFPHNSGYRSQAAITPEFETLQNKSVGKWLTDAGYYTAFLGKYANAIAGKLGKDVPSGWRHYGGFTREYDQFKNQPLGGAYNYYNASQWDLDFEENGIKRMKNDNYDYPIIVWNGVHQADFLATQTLDLAKKAVGMGKPFFIFTNPVMVHHGACEGPFPEKSYYKHDDPTLEYWALNGEPAEISPCVKRDRPPSFLQENFGDWLLHEPTKNFGKPATGMKDMLFKDLSTWKDRYMIGRRNRTLSMVDLDDMVGVIMGGLRKLGVIDNTYVIFTSDNGVHMGDHNLFFGKELPYDHDIRVPLLIRTPHGASGVRAIPTSHVDLTRTIVDIAGAEAKVTPSLDALDGKSFKDALTGDLKVGAWRRFSYSEMFEHNGGRTWRNLRFIGDDGKPEWSMHLWCTGFVEVFKLDEDPDQLLNVLDKQAGDWYNNYGKELMEKWMPVINGMGSCVGNKCSDSDAVAKAVSMENLDSILPCETFERAWADKLRR